MLWTFTRARLYQDCMKRYIMLAFGQRTHTHVDSHVYVGDRNVADEFQHETAFICPLVLFASSQTQSIFEVDFMY